MSDGKLDEKLLKVIACPICKVGVEKINDNLLKCTKCGKEYEVKDGVPNMLVTKEEIKKDGSTS